MDQLIKKFIDNSCNYEKKWDKELYSALKKHINGNDYPTYLLIIGKKAIKEKDMETIQYISSILYEKLRDNKCVLSKENLKFLEEAESISKGQLVVQKRNLYITSFIITFILFLVLYFVFDVSIERSLIFLVLMILLDLFLINKNINRIYIQSSRNRILEKVDDRIVDFVKRH